uniref:Uncharacterized protein n=1 Tax=Anopheles farauti TaxID=69004 RepID=A0A182QHI2_9DIPT
MAHVTNARWLPIRTGRNRFRQARLTVDCAAVPTVLFAPRHRELLLTIRTLVDVIIILPTDLRVRRPYLFQLHLQRLRQLHKVFLHSLVFVPQRHLQLSIIITKFIERLLHLDRPFSQLLHLILVFFTFPMPLYFQIRTKR